MVPTWRQQSRQPFLSKVPFSFSTEALASCYRHFTAIRPEWDCPVPSTACSPPAVGTSGHWGSSHGTAHTKPDTHTSTGHLFCLPKELYNEQTQDASMVQGAASGATAHPVPAQMKSCVLSDEISKTSHFQRNFCNVFSWRNTIISACKVVLSNCYWWTEASTLMSHPHFFNLMLSACMLLASCV